MCYRLPNVAARFAPRQLCGWVHTATPLASARGQKGATFAIPTSKPSTFRRWAGWRSTIRLVLFALLT
jgi:hypothetical protein